MLPIEQAGVAHAIILRLGPTHGLRHDGSGVLWFDGHRFSDHGGTSYTAHFTGGRAAALGRPSSPLAILSHGTRIALWRSRPQEPAMQDSPEHTNALIHEK